MYIGIKDGKIKFYSSEPIDINICVVDEVRQTEEKYMLSDDGTEYILYNQETIDRREIISQVESKEQQYGMNRWQREIILSENSGASEYTKDKAEEIEELAEQLRNE